MTTIPEQTAEQAAEQRVRAHVTAVNEINADLIGSPTPPITSLCADILHLNGTRAPLTTEDLNSVLVTMDELHEENEKLNRQLDSVANSVHEILLTLGLIMGSENDATTARIGHWPSDDPANPWPGRPTIPAAAGAERDAAEAAGLLADDQVTADLLDGAKSRVLAADLAEQEDGYRGPTEDQLTQWNEHNDHADDFAPYDE